MGNIFDLLPRIVFHDSAEGGWFCNNCKQYIHRDVIHNHNCNLGVKFKEDTSK